MTFEELQAAVHANARAKGFYDDEDIIARSLSPDRYIAIRRRLILARLAMIGSEVGEAVDAVRASDDNPVDFMVRSVDGVLEGTTHGNELADIVIRTMDLAAYMGIDLWAEIRAKHAYNLSRPPGHGKLA